MQQEMNLTNNTLTLGDKDLDKLLVEYKAITDMEDELKSKKSNLKEKIVKHLEDLNTNKYDNGVNTATISSKDTYKYDDEIAMINYLNENGYGRYVISKIDTTNFNKELKKSEKLNEDLSKYFTKSSSVSLTVK